MTDPLFDVCDCPELPEMLWWVNGNWEHAYVLTPDRDVAADAVEYNTRNATGFMVRCPRCLRHYATGWG